MNTTPCTETENILNIGDEFISNFNVRVEEPITATTSRSGKSCLKQIAQTNAIQVILTKKGLRPYAIATAGSSIVVPVTRGNIIAQAYRVDGVVTMCCAIIDGVDGETVILSKVGDDEVLDTVREVFERITDACHSMLNGEGFARLKQKVRS